MFQALYKGNSNCDSKGVLKGDSMFLFGFVSKWTEGYLKGVSRFFQGFFKGVLKCVMECSKML